MYVCFSLILTQRKLQLDTLFSQQQDQMLKLDVFFSYTFRLKVLLLVDCARAKLSFFVVPIYMGWIRVWMLLSHPQGRPRLC